MRRNQSGFTLIEIAIVLVIIGLLLGGVLKGQELINSAKVKNFAQDFRTMQTLIYGYQDKFRAIPGDDAAVATHLGTTFAALQATTPNGLQGNGRIDGNWDSTTATDESFLFWGQVRASGFATGTTDTADAVNYAPRNADGGRIGVESGATATPMIAGLAGVHVMCSRDLLGRYVRTLDTLLDDGLTNTGSVRAIASASARGSAAVASADIVDTTAYTVCMSL